MPRDNRTFDLRLVAYTPLSSRIGVIPDMGITFDSIGGGSPTLRATVATSVYGTLPGPELEVAVEWWRASTNTWVEGRDSRYAVTLHEYDDRDLTGTVTLTGVNLIPFILGNMALAGATPYTLTSVRSEAAATNAAATSSGSTITWNTHIIGAGDLVKVVSKGNATNIKSGGIYFARTITTNTFQLSATPTGAILSLGTATLSLSRVVTRIVAIGGSHQFVKSDVVKTTGGSAIGLSDNTPYYVVNPTTATFQLSDKPGGVPTELSTANTTFTNVYRDLDGQRVFTNCTPGTVMTAAYLEARDGTGRGVGLNTLHGFTVGADSLGATWTTITNDPSTPGVGLSFQPGTPGSQMLQALLDNQYCEWYQSGTAGRTFHLVNPLTGNDHTLDAAPMRIGTTAGSVKKTIDYSDYKTAVTVRGVGNVIKTTSGSTSAWGRLEMYETAAGATSNTIAAKIGANEVASHTAQVAYTVTEVAEQAAFLPVADYNRGDWVACQVGGSLAWTKLRVMGWQYAKSGSGNITVTVNLAAVKKTLASKIAKKITSVSAGTVSAGSIGSPLLESDNRKPAAPASVTVTTTADFNSDDGAEAVITAVWPAVTLDLGGGDVQISGYEVWLRPAGALTGFPAASVNGLTADMGPYPSGRTFGVSVRAKSVVGQWGEFSAEVEVTTGFPSTAPAPPTTPTLTSNLGQVRVAWDGLLIDPGAGTVAPLAGFAYVYAEVATSGAGPWTVVGQHLGHSGYTVVGGLTKGTTYFFRLTAVNSIGTAGAASSSASLAVVGVTGPDLVANTLTANEIGAGAITAEEISLGTVPMNSPADRVINPLPNQTYWANVIAGTIAYPQGGSSGATATSTGISLSTAGSFLYVVPRTKAPASQKIYVTGVGSGSHAQFQVKTFTSAADVTGSLGTAQSLTPQASNSIYSLPAGTYEYTVKVQLSTGSGTETITSCRCYEVTGTGTSFGEAAELSPSGLRLYDDSGHLAMDLTTATKQFINIYDNSAGLGAQAVASIDQSGNAVFNDLESASGGIGGTPLVDTTDATDILVTQPNGNYWATEAVLNRFGRGCIYDVTWNSCNALTVTTQYQRIAQDHFVLEDGREYIINCDLGGLQCANNASGQNVYVELQFSLVPLTSVTSGDRWNRAVLYNGQKGYWCWAPIKLTALTGATASANDRLLPAGVPIYWQINTNLSGAPTANYQLDEFGETRGLSVIDIGSAQLVRPTNGALPNATDRSTTGGASGTTTGGTTGQTTTTTFTAAWSRSWNSSGSGIVSGTGQYTDGNSLYQGLGASAMGSKFGFNALGIVGKTVTAMQVYLHWSYWGWPSSTAGCLLGTHGDSAAPATYTGARANAFSHSASAGVGTWINVPSSLWAGFAAGTYRGFTLGVDGTDPNYGYGQGVGHSDPPKLKVTYH